MATEQHATLAEANTVNNTDRPAADTNPGTKPTKAKKTGAVKSKSAASAKKTSISGHPPYQEMIQDAISALKERGGSSQYAITKFIEEKHKQLPSMYKKLVLNYLKKLVAAGKIVKIKGSFKLPSAKPSQTKQAEAVSKAKAKVSQAKPKQSEIKTAKPVKVASSKRNRPKPLPRQAPVAVPKTKKVAGKRKAGMETKQVKPSKAGKISTKTSPGKKVQMANPKKSTVSKKPTAKTVKPKSVKTAAKKANDKKGK